MREKIILVVVGYNRADSVQGLLDFMAKAHYPDFNIRLAISLGHSGSTEETQSGKKKFRMWGNNVDELYKKQGIEISERKHNIIYYI